MQIVYAGYTLADAATPAQGLALNGEVMYEPVALVRAARQRLYLRGNELVTLQFSTAREWPTAREAQRYALGWWSQLPKAGTAQITLGTGTDTEVISMGNAILSAGAMPTLLGVRVWMQYTLVAPGIDLSTPIELPGGGATMVLSGRQSIAGSASTVSVLFPSPFPDKPVVTASVEKPTSGDNIWATVRGGSVTANGFTVDLSGPTPATGYALAWTAVG